MACAAAIWIIVNPWLRVSNNLFIIILSGVVFCSWSVADLVLQVIDNIVEVVDVLLIRKKSWGIHPFGKLAVLRVEIALKEEDKC